MLLKAIRFVLGQIILALDALFAPVPIRRSSEAQAALDQKTQGFVIYQFKACPFCVRVRRALRKLNLKVELRDTQRNPAWEKELIEGGGQLQVPCLRTPEGAGYHWLYESGDIIKFLEGLATP